MKLWAKLGQANPVKETSLKDTGAMVCLAGVNTIKEMGLQVCMLAKTRVGVKWVKGSRLTVLGALAVKISVGDKKLY